MFRQFIFLRELFVAFGLLCSLGLVSCSSGEMRSIYEINSLFSRSAQTFRDPRLMNQYMVFLTGFEGKEKIELIDLRTRRKIPLPGLNSSDSQPISVTMSTNAERIAFVRQRLDQTELLIYRKNSRSLQRLKINPKGIPRRVAFDGSGKVLAVEISRNGSWEIDLIRLSN